MLNAHESNAMIFKAFCDENRLRILELLQNGEKCGCTLQEELPIGQSTLSHHMKILVESGVVDVRKDKKWSYYSLSDAGCTNAIELLKTLLKKDYSELVQCVCTDKEV